MRFPRRNALTLLVIMVPLLATAAGSRTLGEAKSLAAESGGLVLVEGAAEWCGPCKRFERDREASTRLRAALERWSFAAVTDTTPEGERELRRLAVRSFPTFILMRPSGEEIARWSGYRDARTLLRRVRAESADPRTVTEKIAGFQAAPSAALAATIASTLGARSESAEAARWFARAIELDPSSARRLGGDAFFATSSAVNDGSLTYDDLVAAGERWIEASRGRRNVVRSVASVLAGSVPDDYDREHLRPIMTRAIAAGPANADADETERRESLQAALRPPMTLDARLAALDAKPTRDGSLALLSDLQAAGRHAEAARIAARTTALDPEHAAQLSLIALSVAAEAMPSGQVGAGELEAAGRAALEANAGDPHVLLEVHSELARALAGAGARDLVDAHVTAGLALAKGAEDEAFALALLAVRAAEVEHDVVKARDLYARSLGEGWEGDPLQALDMAEFLLDVGMDRGEAERLIRSVESRDPETRAEAERLLGRLAAAPAP